MSGVKKGGDKPNRKIWILFVGEILIVVVLVVAVVIMFANRGKSTAVDPGEDPYTAVHDYTSTEIEDILFEIRAKIRELSGDEMYNYINQELNKYKGTQVEPQLLMTKAWTAIHENRADFALTVVQEINEENLPKEEKLLYYTLMKTIYGKLNDSANTAKYSNLYWGLYDEMYSSISDAVLEEEDEE